MLDEDILGFAVEVMVNAAVRMTNALEKVGGHDDHIRSSRAFTPQGGQGAHW